jgi:nucleotide-binding universal stress UspA family protein
MKVLLGIGGEDGALDRAIEEAARIGVDLTVAVVDSPEGDAATEELERCVRDLVASVGVGAQIRRVPGHGGSRLVEMAEQEGFDRLVLDGGARSPLGKVEIDEVAEFVLLNSRTSVTIVR